MNCKICNKTIGKRSYKWCNACFRACIKVGLPDFDYDRAAEWGAKQALKAEQKRKDDER